MKDIAISLACLPEMRGFPANDGGFAGSAPMVLPKGAAVLNYPVAWDQKSHRILPDSGTHCPCGARSVDGFGDIGIAGQATCRYFQQSFPYFQLKLGAAQV